MKIGILTFHSQLNYGGVLQCWALKTALEKLGHEVVVIDRWMDKENVHLTRGYQFLSGMARVKQAIYSWLKIGDADWRRRVERTRQFVNRRLNLSACHFYQWGDRIAGEMVHCDVLIIGSDQVWHCGDWGDPRVYLLEGFNGNVHVRASRIISYAASFGLRELPEYLSESDTELCEIVTESLYRRGLARFDAISCRECEGCEICQRLGFAATHVVDPTQLLTVADWSSIAIIRHKRQLTCYFLSEDVDATLPLLRRFARQQRCRVKVFVDSPMSKDWLPTPKSPQTAYRWLRGIVSRIMNWRVQILEGAGPVEFVRAHAEAQWVVTDSFHSLMFATTFGKNVRVLRPQSRMRRQMFARMEECALHAMGNLIVDDIGGALASFTSGELAMVDSAWLEDCRQKSQLFLKRQLISCAE